MNLNTDPKETIEIYKLFLGSIKMIAEVEHDTGSKSIVAMPTATDMTLNVKEKTKIPSNIPSNIPSYAPSYTPPYTPSYNTPSNTQNPY